MTSLIIPVFNTEHYLPACFDSVIAAGRRDLEIIVVDDASTDQSSAVIQSFAKEHSEIRVIRLPVNGGLGNARNRGLEVARGEWVMFLDSDDTLANGSLDLLSTSERESEAEMILFGYARLYPGKKLRRPTHNILKSLNGQTVTCSSHPELLRLLNVAWTKAYRRSFLERVGTRFPPGYYEDIPWTYLLLLEASAIDVLDETFVLYRQQREGRILATPSGKHLDLLEQYRRLLSELSSRDHLEWIPSMFERMLDHTTFVLAQGERRLSPTSQQVLFQNLSSAYKEWKPIDYQAPFGLRRVRHSIIERGGRYRLGYRLLFMFRPVRFFEAVFRTLAGRFGVGGRVHAAGTDM